MDLLAMALLLGFALGFGAWLIVREEHHDYPHPQLAPRASSHPGAPGDAGRAGHPPRPARPAPTDPPASAGHKPAQRAPGPQ